MMKASDFHLIARLLSGRVGVTCVPGGGNWQANPTKKIIYYPAAISYTDADLGYLIHEAAHIRFSGISHGMDNEVTEWIAKTGKKGEQVWSLVNALEDIRIEKLIQDVFPGAKNYLDASYVDCFEQVGNHVTKMEMWNPKRYDEEQKHLWLHYGLYFCWLHGGGKDYADGYLDLWHMPEARLAEAIEKSFDLVPKLHDCKDTVELIEFIQKELFPYYLPLCDDEPPTDPKEKEKLEKLLEQLAKDLVGMVMKAMAAKAKAAKSGKPEKPGKGGKGMVIALDPKSFMKPDGSKAEKIAMKMKPSKGGRKIDSVDLSEIFRPPVEDEFMTEEDLLNHVQINLAKVRKGVSVLKDLETVRYEGSYESGKLQSRKLYKLYGSQTNKIFTRKIADVKDNRDMAVALLVDESGSMQDSGDSEEDSSKAREACIATAVMAKALALAGKPYAVYGFNDEFFVHKKWNERLSMKEMLTIEQNAWGSGRGYNNDGFAIQKVIKELAQRREQNKVLIVLSDGEPAPSSRFYSYDLKDEAKKAERVAKVYSIGINSTAVKHYYKRWAVVRNTSELGVELVKIFNENAGGRIR